MSWGGLLEVFERTSRMVYTPLFACGINPPMTLAALPPLRDVIDRHNLRAEKKWGQHFLLDMNVTDKIARVAGDLCGVHVLEVGPGPGGLTRSLLTHGAKVTAVEVDPRAVKALQEVITASDSALTVVHEDALAFDAVKHLPAPRAVVANLPYNVATPLILNWLKDIHQFESITVMIQKEVALRLAAGPSTKAYGRLSVMTQWLADVELCFHLPPSAFSPPPKVDSTVVRLSARERDDSVNFETMERVVKQAFSQRRKKLRKLVPGLPETYADQRAEELSVADFIKVCESLSRTNVL